MGFLRSELALPLTFSGGLITDAVRTANIQGDGLTPPAGVGVWEATTNLCTNGGFETDLTGWTALNTTVATRVTSQAKFGTASAQVVLDTTNQVEGIFFAINYTNGTVYTISAWVNGPAGEQLRLATSAQASSPVTLAGGWQRLTFTFTAGVAETTLYVIRAAGATSAITYYVDGVQAEAKPIATPYVQTNGGTAARAAGRVQAPATLLSATQGWVAFRVRLDVDLSSLTDPRLFEWGDDSTHLLRLFWSNSQGKFRMQRGNGTLADAGQAATVTAGTVLTVVAAWDATTTKVSINGAAFTSAANTGIPTLAATLFDLATGPIIGGISPLDGDIFWFACGTGTLTNTDAATINGFGNTPPALTSVPGNVTDVWQGVTASSSQLNYAGFPGGLRQGFRDV